MQIAPVEDRHFFVLQGNLRGTHVRVQHKKKRPWLTSFTDLCQYGYSPTLKVISRNVIRAQMYLECFIWMYRISVEIVNRSTQSGFKPSFILPWTVYMNMCRGNRFEQYLISPTHRSNQYCILELKYSIIFQEISVKLGNQFPHYINTSEHDQRKKLTFSVVYSQFR